MARARELQRFEKFSRFVKSEVEVRLKAILAGDRERAAAHGTDIALLHDTLSELCLRGGKRLRAALVTIGYGCAAPGADPGPAVHAGVALELLQAYFLVHDDWMDQDATRRGGPTVHEVLRRKLKDTHLGAASAILAGDYLVALASRTLALAGVPADALVRGFVGFADMQLYAVMGQQLDLLARAPSIEHMYALKTASYSVAGPLELGVRLGGGSKELGKALIDFGVPLGVAFQLKDDLIGVFGDPKETGKPFASDLVKGKRTALISHALERLSGAPRKKLAKVWGNRRATASELRQAVGLCETCGARELVEQRITALVGQALAALEASELPEEPKELLRAATHVLTERTS